MNLLGNKLGCKKIDHLAEGLKINRVRQLLFFIDHLIAKVLLCRHSAHFILAVTESTQKELSVLVRH